MKRLLLLTLLFCSFVSSNAQLKMSEKTKIAELLHKRINDHREEKGHALLKRNADLAKAAKVQCEYITQAGKLSHRHPAEDWKTVKHRVASYNKSFIVTGENILYSKPTNLPLSKAAISKLAYDMYNSWKNSKGHYANMISDEYSYGDFAFDYDPNTRRVYAVHVFGKKGYKIPGQLSENAFGILSTDEYCSTLLGGHQNVVTNIGNSIAIEGDEIVLRYHNVEFVKEVFEDPKDGLAIDLVERDQMPCGEDNRLDASEIYDGVLLKPIYRDEIFANNKAQNPRRLVVTLGKVPTALIGKELSPNMVIIKLGMLCNYVVPASVPSGQYALRAVDPVLYNPNIALKTEGIGKVDQVLFDFDTGMNIAKKVKGIPEEKKKVQKIDIKSFTSIDGSYSVNKDLHQKRAEYIKQVVLASFEVDEETIQIDAKENWELCDYQLEVFGLEALRTKEKKEIRQYINTHKTKKWSSALDSQRKSKAIIYQYNTWKKEDSNHLYNNLLDGLVNEDHEQTNKALAEIYKDTTNAYFLGEDFIMDKLFDKKELVQNVAALLLKDVHGYSRENVVYFVRNWLARSQELSEGAQKNLLNLYTITGRKMLQYWDVSAENLSKVMHPYKVKPLFENYKSEDVVNPLFLNFHMMRIKYFSQINESEEVGASFNFITDYFREQATTVDDDIALSLFFNGWSRYDLTTELLQERLWEDQLNERASFILAQTLNAYPYTVYDKRVKESRLLAVHKKAMEFNQEKWCNWINLEFQNLRLESIKNLYCQKCNLK